MVSPLGDGVVMCAGQEPVPLHKAAVEMAAQHEGPTAVPRNTGVADGPWSPADISLVEEAKSNEVAAPKARKTKRFAEHGEILLRPLLMPKESPRVPGWHALD